MGGEQTAHALEIVGRVDADGVVGGFDRLDADAVLERAQLLERFGAFERGLRRAPPAGAGRAAVDVQADVAPCRRLGLPGPREGNGRARKIEREAVPIDDHLGDVAGSASSAASSIRRRSVLISSAASVGKRRDRRVDHPRLEQRLVPLHVDDRGRSRATRPLPRADPCRSDAPRDVSTARRRTPSTARDALDRRWRRSRA